VIIISLKFSKYLILVDASLCHQGHHQEGHPLEGHHPLEGLLHLQASEAAFHHQEGHLKADHQEVIQRECLIHQEGHQEVAFHQEAAVHLIKIHGTFSFTIYSRREQKCVA
jgi:hypothetical protein